MSSFCLLSTNFARLLRLLSTDVNVYARTLDNNFCTVNQHMIHNYYRYCRLVACYSLLLVRFLWFYTLCNFIYFVPFASFFRALAMLPLCPFSNCCRCWFPFPCVLRVCTYIPRFVWMFRIYQIKTYHIVDYHFVDHY